MFVSMTRSDESVITFRRSFAARLAILFILGAVDWMAFIYFKEAIRKTQVGQDEYIYCVPILLIVLINSLMLRFAGPEDLVLDIDRQVYTRTSGMPLFPKTFRGTFGDFYGLCIRETINRRKQVVGYRVELDWNTPDHKPLVLAETITYEAAQKEQHILAKRLASIPIAKD